MSFHSVYNNSFDHLRFLIDHHNKALKSEDEQGRYQDLVKKVMVHCEEYYQAKLAAVEHDVLDVYCAPWCTTLERALMWIGGWRPTTAFRVLYTESRILSENNMGACHTGDLGDLSAAQLCRINELLCETVQLVDSISDELSDWQGSSSVILGPKADVDKKMAVLMRIVSQADDLRLKTIKKVVDLLSPRQAAEFLVAAAELQFGIRDWGMAEDRKRG